MERKNLITMQGNPLTLVGPELEVGKEAPDFTVCDQALKPVSLKNFQGKYKVISTTPSLDTPVCDLQARTFNDKAASLAKDVVVMNISMDLPFAIGRFCTAENVDKIRVLSDYKDASFGESWGLLIKELRLLARGVFVLDKENVVHYASIVNEQTKEPEYEAPLRLLQEMIEKQ